MKILADRRLADAEMNGDFILALALKEPKPKYSSNLTHTQPFRCHNTPPSCGFEGVRVAACWLASFCLYIQQLTGRLEPE